MTDEPKLKDVEMEEFLSVCEGECEHPYCWAKKSGGLAASPVVQSESERCPKFWERIQCRLESGHEQPHQFDHTKPVVPSEPDPPAERVYLPHETRPVQVWADVDLGIADMVIYLNTIEGVRTQASCQGTIGEGGPNPYGPQVMCTWTPEAFPRLQAKFDVEPEGNGLWGYVHPKKDSQIHIDEMSESIPPVPSRESTLPELEKVERFWGVDVNKADGTWARSEDNPVDNNTPDFGDCVRASDYDRALSALTAARAQVAERDQIITALKTCVTLGVEESTHWFKRANELAAQVALLQQQEPRWRSVETELPPIDPALLATQDWWKESSLVEAWGDVTSFGDDIMLAHYDWSDGKWFDQHGENFAIQGITYWRPIDLVPPEGTDYGLYPSQVAARKTASPAPYAPPEKETEPSEC